ncbi:MAG: PspA/IM30 family protein [Chloroflexi bacterium]|nr:PspA/IM30 family protein [Chloroflexota bacterium]
MGLLARMSTLLKAKTSSILERTENPSETLDYSYEKLQAMLRQVQRGIVEQVTAKHRLAQQASQLRSQSGQLDNQARQALQAGREDLARMALQRKQAAVEQLQGLDEQVASLEAEQQRLTTAEMNLRTKVEAFRTHKEVLKARYVASEAEVRIGEALHGVGEEMADVGLTIERAEQKTSQLRARAAAIDELAAAGTLNDVMGTSQSDLSLQLGQITAAQNVEDELALLKGSLGPGAEPKQLASGQ